MDMKGKRIFVGLSGGVDSAVTATLLTEAGADVTGVFIKGWYPPELPCTWSQDRRDAMRVAAKLRIPFITLDASQAYKQSVIDYLTREYRAGRTPNPDVMCNKDVKFGVFYRFAKGQGADAIATGHYARVENGRILRGADPAKDQSYFLWAIEAGALRHTLLPLGAMKKSAVRALATTFSLPVADKKDSQGICFLGPVSIEDFLETEIGLTPGLAYDAWGEKVGMHRGAIAYTLGERARLDGTRVPGPWYVVKKDAEANTLVVSREPSAGGLGRTLRLTDTNWFAEPRGTLSAQYRYHGPLEKGLFDSSAGAFSFEQAPKEPIAPGQSLVLYDGDVLIGGGIIAE